MHLKTGWPARNYSLDYTQHIIIKIETFFSLFYVLMTNRTKNPYNELLKVLINKNSIFKPTSIVIDLSY